MSSTFAHGAKLILAANVAQKLITFTMNQVLLRWTTPEIVGQASIQLELLLSTMLFLSREGIRIACLRETVTNKEERAALVNISWIPCIVLCFFGLVAIVFGGSGISTVMILYWSGACLESLGEPWFNVFQNALIFRARLTSEMVAVFVRCVVSFVCVGYFQMHLMGFGCAQFAYGLSYLITMVSHMRSSGITNRDNPLTLRDFLPSVGSCASKNKDLFYLGTIRRSTAHVAASSVLSSLVKHGLTEADKIVLTLSASNYNQGIYAVTNNYGSLVARMIFLPLEDASKLMFSKYVATLRSAFSSTELKAEEKQQQCTTALQALKSLLIQLLRLVCIIGIFFPVFGFAYSELVVNLIFSRQWRSNETVNTLSYYCFYIFFMAINGISEAFVQSTFPASAYRLLSLGLLISTAVFVATAVPGIQYLGTSGIVIANCASYAARIIFNLTIVHQAFVNVRRFFLDGSGSSSSSVSGEDKIVVILNEVQSPLIQLVPTVSSVMCMLFFFILANLSAYRYAHSGMALKDTLIHVAVGGAAAVSMLAVIVLKLCPREDVNNFKRLLLRQKQE